MRKAFALGQACKRGDILEIKKAEEDHEAYRQLCLKADEMTLGVSIGQFTR